MAAMQLKYTSKSVTEIAALVGFLDPKHFSKVFKKHTGFSPLQYRKQTSDQLVI
jgi:two-component system response regulator YesN